MNDLISRQAAIEELSYCQTYLFDTRDHDEKISLEDAEYAIERLPSEQQWIPVEKETPILTNIVLVCDSLGKILFDSYIDGSWTYCPYVVAWMPLPEPYKGEES